MTYARTSRHVEPDALLKQKIVTAFHRQAIADATGVADRPYERHVGEPPSSRFWLGTLVPEAEVMLPDRPRESVERHKPASQGFSLKVPHLPVTLDINVSFAVWVTLHPTYEEQLHRAGLDDESEERERTADDDTNARPRHSNDAALQLARPRTKIPISDVSFEVTLDTNDLRGSEPRHVGGNQIAKAVREALDIVPSSMTLHRPLRRPGGRLPRLGDIRDQQAWHAWEDENLGDPAHPEWYVQVDAVVRSLGGEAYEVLLTMVNRSPDRDHQFSDKDDSQNFVSWACDPSIYEAKLTGRPAGGITPYQLEQIPESYRYDRTVNALGWNTAVRETDAGGFSTVFAATAETERVWPRRKGVGGKPLDTSFTTLYDDPLPALDRLIESASAWSDENWGRQALDELASIKQWSSETRERAGKDRDEVERELEWVLRGKRLLEARDDVVRAFRLMNKTMSRVAGDDYDSWYPFQIAFILGCLPSVADPATDDMVDILWFPTGGGKTEAYLGLNVFSLFLERLKGRTGGSQTWARFPLRLLSLQQTQRFAESVLLAETVRLDEEDVSHGEPFGVGYLVGSGNTPNRIELPDSRFYDGWDPYDDKNAESCRVIEFCPACNKRPTVEFHEPSHTMEHRCTTAGCQLEGRLPVYVIDDDIHRWAPSVIVGTVDKLTQISWSNGFRHLLGHAFGRCPQHGLSRKHGQCAVYPCDRTLQPVSEGFGGLMVEIQDEMHLLSESLGALDGNYETLFHSIAEACGIPRVKILGATATIEGYKEQSDHLYRREPRRFPLPGPTRYESFWAFENPNDPLRTYVAILPRGTTMLDAAFRITRSHEAVLRKGLQDPGDFCDDYGIPSEQASEVQAHLRDLYDVFTTYALRKKDLGRYERDVKDSPRVCPEGGWASITGDVDFWDVRDVLDRLEDPADEGKDRLRVLGATSAISHGVDVNRLNVMCVMGMPNQTSEFIQATARVGRMHPGLVFCLINPMRKRDVSHFRYFRKWAEYLDRLVEHVPVNRESLPVLEIVLPGGLMAWLLQIAEPEWLEGGSQGDRRNRLWWAQEVARAICANELTEESVSATLMESFRIHPSSPRFARHRERVKEFVDEVFRRVRLSKGSENSMPDLLESNDTPVPRSLRAVDTVIPIRGEW